MESTADRFTAWQRDEKPCKNEGRANNHRGALEFIRWLRAGCQEKGHQRLSRMNNSRQQWLFSFFFCPTVTRNLFFVFNLITVDAAGVMRTRGQRYDICKQTAFEFSGMGWDRRAVWGLKIPQTGYEARCWGWRTPTSDKRMCSINATVACQQGRKRGNAGEWVCLRVSKKKKGGGGVGVGVAAFMVMPCLTKD